MGKQGFSGMSFPFRFDGRGGVAKSTTSHIDFSHIKEGIIQILGTSIGERAMELDFGSEVNKVQFSSIDNDISKSELDFYIRDAIAKWDNRVEVKKIDIQPFSNETMAGFLVDLHLHVVKFMQDFSLSAKIVDGGVYLNE